jgi:hypothetical protein
MLLMRWCKILQILADLNTNSSQLMEPFLLLKFNLESMNIIHDWDLAQVEIIIVITVFWTSQTIS